MQYRNAFTKILLILCFIHLSCSAVIQTPVIPKRETKKSGVYRGVYHVHSEFSHDSKASLSLIQESAKKADLDFVLITDHNNMNGRSEVKNNSDSPLLLFGNEISTWHDGHLGAIGIAENPPETGDTQVIIDNIRSQKGYSIIAHPLSPKKPWTNWNLKNYDGIEVFCFSDVFYEESVALILKAIIFPPKSFLESMLETPKAGLKLWDKLLRQGKKISGFGAVDAHLKLRLGNTALENYSLYLQTVTMYVLANDVSEIINPLGEGKSFVAFEVRGLAQDFSFTAKSGNEAYQMGDTIKVGAVVQFEVTSPQDADIRLIHNGNVIKNAVGTSLQFESTQNGFYRVEVYLNGELWIFSNPIYLES